MKVRQALLLIGALGSALVLSATAARAQGGFLTFEFNFSNPGARSLGRPRHAP